MTTAERWLVRAVGDKRDLSSDGAAAGAVVAVPDVGMCHCCSDAACCCYSNYRFGSRTRLLVHLVPQRVWVMTKTNLVAAASNGDDPKWAVMKGGEELSKDSPW